MGRPSRAIERREQILRAAARCIMRHGLADVTLERISAESGLSRSHVRHYLGNREEVIGAVWDFVMTPYAEAISAALAVDDPAAGLSNTVDYLFGPQFERNDDDAVADALIAGAVHDADLRTRVFATYRALEGALASGIRATTPGIGAAHADNLAYSILSLALGGATLSGLPFPGSRRPGTRRIARQLLGLEPVP